MKLCETCGGCFDDDYDACGYDGGALVTFFPGPRVIGARYLLEQRVAAGAMGVVVRATHLQVGSTVAVKLMRPENEDTHVALARFQREAQILGQIKHPNAVLVIDFGVEQRGHDSAPYLVMEFLRGESLSSVLERRGPLSLDELERILGPLCDAVEEAHAVGVIHRDIKPGNVVLERLRDGSEIVKVLDFGIARYLSSSRGADGPRRADVEPVAAGATAPEPVTLEGFALSGDGDEIDELAELLADDDDEDEAWLAEVVSTRQEVARPTVSERVPGTPRPAVVDGGAVGGGGAARDPTTEAGIMIGTVPYMAPEQMTGERISVRTDVHAVAVLAFQCLAGRLPYEGEDDEIIAAKLADERPSLFDVGVDAPAEVEDVLRRSFALDPAERPATVREIGEVLKHAVHAARAPSGAPLVGARAGADGGFDAVAEIEAITRSLAGAEAAAHGWVESAAGEEHYKKARDALLAVDAPLKRVRAVVEAAEPLDDDDDRAALVDARRALEAQVSAVRRSLARIEPAPGPVAGGVATEYGDYLAALWTRLDATAQEIVAALKAVTGEDKAADTGPYVAVQLFAEADSPRDLTLADITDRLLARDPLDAVDAVEELLQSGVELVVHALGPGGDDATAVRLARGLWRHADTILLHELSPARRAFRLLPFLAGLRGPTAAPFALLARMFGAAALDDDGVSLGLAALERADDRAVLARCLLVHPSEVARRRAAASLELSDLWNVIAHPSTPVAVCSFLFQHVSERAPNEYLKIFFFCVRESLRAAASGKDVLDALALVSRFFQIPCFHEDIVFEPLLDLDRTLRARSAGFEDAAYAEALAAFTAGGAHESKPLEHMRDIPLAIQRKLAREGRFLTYFVSHSNDRVARETLPHLFRLDDITPFLRIATIHRVVLTELAKRKRFFRKEPPKLALLQNPKTPAIIARVFLPLVASEQLRLLAGNKHINPDVRRLITATLARGH